MPGWRLEAVWLGREPQAHFQSSGSLLAGRRGFFTELPDPRHGGIVSPLVLSHRVPAERFPVPRNVILRGFAMNSTEMMKREILRLAGATTRSAFISVGRLSA